MNRKQTGFNLAYVLLALFGVMAIRPQGFVSAARSSFAPASVARRTAASRSSTTKSRCTGVQWRS